MMSTKEMVITRTVAMEQSRLFNFIQKRVKSTLDAEDILQEVFYQLARVSEDINTIEKMSAWLFRVARNKITDLYRKKKSLRFSDMNIRSENSDGEDLFFEDCIQDGNDLQDTLLTREKVWEVLEEGLSEIPEEQRMVFTKHEMEDMSFKEIAEITGEPVNTLISRKRYAILYLRNKLSFLYREIMGD